MKWKAVVAAAKAKVTFAIHKLYHRAETLVHCTYLSAVSIEAHGMYAKAAFVLLIVVIIGAIVGEH